MTWLFVAMVSSACAAALAFGPDWLTRLQPVTPRGVHRSSRHVSIVGAAGAAAIAWVAGGVILVGWLVAFTIVGGTIAWLWWTGRRRIRLARIRGETARTARVIASQLRIGQVPTTALTESAADCAELEPVVATLRVGGDAVEALRAVARTPGREGLGDVADAWQLSASSGAPIADAVDEVADRLRDDEATLAVVTSELAAPRATGRTLACLPLLGLAMGFFAGGDPLAFISTSVLGQWLVVVGVGLAAAGVWWIEHLADSVK